MSEFGSDAGSLQNLKNHFLLAMPGVSDPIFAHSVTYICEHNSEGAMGIVINRPLDISWRDIFEHLEIDDIREGEQPVLAGGPVQMDRGFVLHRGTGGWESSLPITSDIVLTTSMDIIDALAHGEGPPNSLMALGYAGWGAGQLEDEMARNFWLSLPADDGIIFDVPLADKAQAAADKLGVDISLLSMDAGHA